jgi:hypothetical protein
MQISHLDAHPVGGGCRVGEGGAECAKAVWNVGGSGVAEWHSQRVIHLGACVVACPQPLSPFTAVFVMPLSCQPSLVDPPISFPCPLPTLPFFLGPPPPPTHTRCHPPL